MKFGRFVKKAGFISVILSALIISFSSCDVEIGLGSSVDTRPPELAINYPPAGAVIRDVFTISGTCSDDGVIAGVSVDLKQTDNTALSYTMQGVFNQKEGVWSCEINPLDTKTPIPDGSYEITVTIKDSVDRETIRTRQYTIDNTAPVIAITRPSAVIPTGSDPEKYTTSNEFDSFGQDFVVEGHVADTCERRYISVDIYDLNGNLKYSTLNAKDEAQKRIKIDSDFSTTIASFGDEAYTAIYGDDDEAGTQKFFCEITVYDNARKYPVDGKNITADDLVGNKAEYFYMYEGELYNRVFDSYGMTNAYKLLNGSYEDDGSRSENESISPDDAKKDLENKAYKETRGFLSLNPKNNPYFKVSGHEALDKEEMENGTVFDDDNNKITNNSTVVVEVYPGLDQTPLIQDNLGLYLLQADFEGNPIDSNGNVVKADEAEKIWLVRPLTDKDGSAILSEEDNAEEIAARKNLISKIGSTYKFTVYLTTKEPTANNKELAANNYYLFGVQGWDKKAVPVKNADSILGFMLVESGTAPSLTIKTITPEWITTNVNTTEAPDLVDENAVKTFSVEMAFAGDAPYRLSRIVNDGEPVDVLKISDDHRLSDYTDKYTPETGAVSGTIKYILTGSNNLTSTKEINFKVDNERPTVGEIEVPNVNVTEKSSFTFKGTVSAGDSATNSEIADVQMKLSYVAGENTVDSGWISVGNTSNWEHTVVFQEDEALKTIFAKEGSKKIEVRSIDKAGNISEVKQSSFVYDTGRPELTVQSYKMGDNAAQQIKSEFFISEAFAISGKATDTYGIDAASLKLTQVKGVGEDAVTIEIPIENINDKGEWTVGNLPRNTQAGSTNEALVATDDYTFTISVTDLTGVKKETSAAYKVSIDLEAPVVAITSPSADEIVSGDTTRITGTLNDGNGTGISGYSYKFVKAGENAANVAWTDVASKASNFSFYKDLTSGNTIAANSTALCEGSWNLYLKAKDEAGNESDVVVQNFKVDMNDPALTSAITTSSTCISQSGLYYFKGDLSGTASATDTNEPEKIKIEFKLGSEVIQPTITGNTWTIPASSFTANTPTTLAITAYDAVGNQTKKEYQVYYDVTAPSVNVAASALQNGAVVNSFPLTIYGTADDGTGIGATSIYYSLDGSEPATELVAASSSWTKEITGTGLTEGSKTLKLKIKDALNNESAVTQITFNYDRSDPTLTETGIGESGATVNTNITLQGTAGDTNGIDSIEITDSANEESRWTIASSDMTESEDTLTWSKTISLGSEVNTLADGRHNFTIIVKDLAGKQTKLTRSVLVDTTAPEVLTITTPATDEQATGTNAISNATYKFIGTAQDNGSGIASYSYVFTHSSTAPASGWTNENAENGEWEITKTLTAASETNCLEQGEWYLFVKATDKAGNTVTAPVSRHFWIDMGAPSVTDVNIAGETYYFSTNTLTITGKSIDTHGLKETGAVVIKKTAVGDTAANEVLASINASAVSSNGSWSATLAEDAIPSDGTPVTLTIESTDIVGKTSGVNTYTVCKDMVAPVVTVSPASNAAMAYQSSVNIQFSGTAVDANLDEVKAELYKNNETTATSTTTLSPDRTTGAWTWKVYDLGQASYKLKVIAKDKAGNTSNYTSGSVTVDTTAPKTTVNGTSLYEANGTAAEAVLSNGTVEEIEKKYALSSYTLSGTITDANFESLVLKENGTTKTVTLTGSDWTYTPAAFTTGTEVTNNYTITVKDKAENITSYSLTVAYDTKAPEIVISSPEDTYYPTVPDANGTVRDSGIGIAEVKYSIDNTTWADTNWTSGMNWSVDIATMVTEEGPVTLYLKAKDKFGNESNPPVSVSFSYDSAAPGLEETDTVTGPTGNNVSFTLTGKAWDNNGLSRIEIEDQTKNKTYSYKISGTTDTTPWNDNWKTGDFISLTAHTAQNAPDTDNWSATFVAGNDNSTEANYFEDGTHQLVIRAYDVAGRASTAIYKSVFVDLNDPVVTITTPSAAASTNQTTYLFRGTIQEANLDKATLWVYRVKQGTETEDVRISNAAGETLSPSYNSGTGKYDWSYTGFDFENDSEYYVKVTALDRAGRTNTKTSSRVFVDNQAPTTSLTGSGLYASGASGLTSITTLANQETYYARGAYTLSGTVTENKAMGSVQVKVDNNATDTLTLSSNAWTKTGVTTDGNHKYAITVKDAAGNSSMYSINVVYDATNPEVLSATVPTTSSTEGVSYKFTGTAQDSGSGLKKIEVQIVNNGATPSETGWTEALGLTSWNSTIVFSEYNVFSTEGIKTLCVRATDEVGNVSTVFTKKFVYDKAEPTLEDNTNPVKYTPAGGSAVSLSTTTSEPVFNVNGQFKLSGKAYDSNGVKEIVITQKINNGSEVEIERITGIDAQTRLWETAVALPRDPGNIDSVTGLASTTLSDIGSGEYIYKITVTDIAGNDTSITEASAKSVTKTFKATIDKSAPQITGITSPSSPSSNTGLNAISVVSFRFAGTAEDNANGYTGVSSVWYKIIGQNESNPAAPTANTTFDSAWTGEGFDKASGDYNWFFSQAFKPKGATGDGREEGQYKVVVYAVDAAGNVSSAASQIFDVDMAAPEIETVLDSDILEESMTQTKTRAYEFKYKVTESYGLAANNPVVTIRKDNEALTSGTDFTEAVDGDYKVITITNHTDGLYEYTISATDLVGKNSTIRRNILLDTTPPTLAITSPDLSGYQNTTSVKVNGSSEDKSGTHAVWYSFGAADMPSLPEGDKKANWSAESKWTDDTWTGWKKADGTTSWSFTVNGEEGTDKNLYIAAVDTNGAVTTSGTISAVVKVDVNNPVLTETGIGTGTQSKNANFTFSGSASDAGSGLAATNPVTITGGATPLYPTVAEDGSWSYEINISFLDEGDYEYTITATDKVGKVSTIRRNIVVDKSAPVLKITSPDLSEYQNALNVKINGTSEDRTGTHAVWYSFGAASMPAIPTSATTTDSSWTGSDAEHPIWRKASGTASWNFTVNGEEGTDKNLYIAAVDTNGTVTTSAIHRVVKVDVNSPTLKETGIDVGTQYKNAAFTLTGEASDGGSGLATTNPVTISDGTNTYHPTVNVSTSAWSETITLASDGTDDDTYTYTITAKDNSGKESTLSRTVVYDTQKPSVSTKVIGTVAASLKQTINNVDWYKTTQIPVTISGSDATAGVQTIECSTDHSNWNTLSKSGDTFTGTISCTSQGANTIYIQVTDKAGNKNTDDVDWNNVTDSWLTNNTLTVHVDTTAPELTATSYSYDGGTTASITDSVHVNGSKTLTVSGSYSDAGAGVDSLTFKVGSTSITPEVTYSENTWTTTFTPKVGGQLSIKGKDKLNNASQELTPFTIIYDNTAPTISNISLNGAYKPSASSETYYTNNTNTEFKLTGVAADNTGVETVSVVIKNSAGTATTIAPVINAGGNGSLNNWNFTLADDTNKNAWKALATSATAVVTVTDKAKNVATQTVTINFDVEAPSAKHELDASSKDLYFRVGNQNRDDGAPASGTVWIPVWIPALDEGVGGKYSAGTFGNETSIDIRGRFDDPVIRDGITGSGVKIIYYKIFSKLAEATAATAASVRSGSDGSFSLKSEESKRVFFTKSSTMPANDTTPDTDSINIGTEETPIYKYYKSISTNFSEKLTGFNEGSNYLVLAVEDNVGNIAIDSVQSYSLNVDRTAPTLTSNTTETLYTNAASGTTINLSGSVSDDDGGAGVAKVVIIDPTVTKETELGRANVSESTWSYPLDATILANKTGTTSIYAKAYDKAGSGNWTKVEVARVVVDTTAPTIELDDPDDADNAEGTQINGTIKLTGKASDKIGETLSNKFEVTKIEYRMTKDAQGDAVTYTEENPDGWAEITITLMPDFKIASSESFVVSGFDTTNLTDKATYELRAVVEDSAGNTTESEPIEVVVDQDTDRPVITLSNIALPASGIPYLKSTKTLYLSASDDDGVSEVKYKVDNATNWTQLTGSSITVNGNDGEHTINFQITDKKNTTFNSTGTSIEGLTVKTPKITDGTTGRSGTLSINIVTQKPAVSNIQYSVYDAQKVPLANQTDADRWSAFTNDVRTLSSLRYNKFKISLSASSVQGINSAAVTTTALNGVTTAVNFTCADNSHNDADSHVWTSDEIEIVNAINGEAVNGIKEISLSVEDDAEMVYEQTLSINVDNISPKISISQPSNLIGQEETLRGDITGENHVTLYYAVSRYCKMKSEGENKPQIPDEENLYSVNPEDTINVIPGDEIKKDSDGTTVLATKWTKLEQEDTGLKWYVYFDEKDGEDHTDKLGTYLTESYLGITTADAIADTSNPYEARTPVYFWIKAVDDFGNEAVAKQKLNIDPQGERPIVEISYPTNTVGVDEQSNPTSTPPILSGTIRMTGTATDNNAAKYVWIQIHKGENGSFNATDLAFLNTADESDSSKRKYNYKLGHIKSNTEKTIDEIASVIENEEENITDYGIMVEVKGSGWSQTINSKSEFNATGNDKTATLNITVYATDGDSTPHKSLPATQTIIIDSRKPYVEQSSLELVQYDSSGNISARKPYSQDVKISDIWYLIGNIKDDDSGIALIEHNGKDGIKNTSSSNGKEFTDNTDTNYWFKKNGEVVTQNGTNYNYKFSVPLGSKAENSVGTSTIKFKIKELTDTGLESEPSYSVTYDNKAPVLKTEGDSLIRLERNVQNSNGFYTFGAIAKEESVEVEDESGVTEVIQSGVKRIAFYFTRDLSYGLKELDSSTYSKHATGDNAVTRDLFDVMIYHKNNDIDDTNSGNMIVDYTSLTKEDGLYWHSIRGNLSNKTFTYNASTTAIQTATKNIHKKGLAKINGAIYLIDDVTVDNVTESNETVTVTLNEAPGDGENVDALFAVCNVIDSGDKNAGLTSSEQGYGYGYYGSRVSDDGDLITESFSKQGTNWNFDASINSKNLPDGPITLHLVAFDEAGNYSEWASPSTEEQTDLEQTDKSFVVSNNAPRIAGMRIGTDENGDGSVGNEEFTAENELYSNIYALGYDKSGFEVTNVTLPVQNTDNPISALTVKGLTEVKPELVGGNGKIYYTYKVYKHTSGQNWETTAEYTKSAPVEITTGTTDAVATLTHNISLPVSDFIGKTDGEDLGAVGKTGGIHDGTSKKFEFSFSDSTPGKTAEEGTSNNATLNVIMDIALRETNKAKNYILPFYWNSKTDNSLFGQSKDNGHIELAKDWVTTTSYSGTTGTYDADPKVSGKIKIEGIAQDDTLLRAINVQFGKSMGGLGKIDTSIATYNTANGTWTVTALNNDGSINSTTGWASAVKQATFGELVKTGLFSDLPAKVTDNVEELGKTVGGNKKEYLSTQSVPYTSQEFGHVVHWILYIDTEKVTDTNAENITVTANDVEITATATDRGTPKWNNTSSSAIYTANEAAVTGTGYSGAVTKTGTAPNITVTEGVLTGNYRMDIVPYISGLDRPDAKTKTHRSRRGKYQVVIYSGTNGIVGEDLVITGFNLPGTATSTTDTTKGIKLQTTAAQDGSTNGTGITTKTRTNYTNNSNTMVFAAPTTSGYIKVVTNSISSINNFNADSDYNKMESDYSGDEWYDDVYLNTWKNDEYFYYSNDPISPSMDKVPNAGKKQHRLYGGWGTQGSRTYASYANTTGTGSSGNAPNPTSGENAPTETSCQNTTGNNNGYGDPISYYDVATDSDGNRYNVIVDCWQGSGGGWGRNFVINKNGHSSFNGQSGSSNPNSSETSMKYVIERMGAGGTNPDSANSSDGFDEMFNQFLNVRIAVSSAGEAYITYYDRYAKCLKWAMAGNYNGNNPRTKYATEGIRLNGNYSGTTGVKSPYYKNGGFVVAGYDTLQTGGTYSNLNVGLWSDIAIESSANGGSGKPVIAYYDTTNRRLMLATSAIANWSTTNPVNTNTPVLEEPAEGQPYPTSTTEGNAWTRIAVTNDNELKELRLGEYVSLVLDGGNNIHIACKDSKNSALYYIYGARSSYGSYTFTGVCVDNNGSPGTWTDIKLTTPTASGAAAGPVISYYDPTNDSTEDAIKVAYYEAPAGTVTNPHLQSSNWDTMTVPCNTPATANRITLAMDVTDGATYTDNGTTNNSKLAIGYVSSRFDCVYLRKE